MESVSCRCPFKQTFRQFLETLYKHIAWLIVCFIRLYDLITTPINNIVLTPWTVMERANRIRCTRENLALPNSPYFRIGEHRMYFLKNCKTIIEAQKKCLISSPPNQPSLGYRQVLDMKMVYCDIEKKTFRKYALSDYNWLSITEVDQKITELQKAFYELGVKDGVRVSILSETRIEWFLCAHAILRLKATITTLYPSLNKEAIQHGLEETQSKVIVTSADLSHKLSTNLTPYVTDIIVFDSHVNPSQIEEIPFQNTKTLRVLPFEEFVKLGQNEKSIPSFDITEDTPAVILYTSGSTGKPKGVMMTHKNFLTSVKGACTILTPEVVAEYRRHCWYGYLPLAHILEFVSEMLFFCFGIKIGYGTPHTITDYSTGILKDQKGDLSLLKPTIFPGVPLTLERIRKKLIAKLEGDNNFMPSFMKTVLFELAEYKNSCIENGMSTPIFNRFIAKLLKAPFGSNVEYMLIGGAPLSQETQKLIRSLLNVKILIGYGTSETCGANMIMDLDDLSLGNVGAPLFGVKVRLEDWEEGGYTCYDKPYPRGELYIGGDVVCQGYISQPELSKESFFNEKGIQWFRTGDIAEVNEYGIFRIIDRKKDLIKLQHGEYVSLGKVEKELKNCILLDNVCVFANLDSEYLVAIIVPNWTNIKPIAVDFLKNNHENDTDVTEDRLKELCNDDRFVQIVLDLIKRFCVKDAKLEKVEIPQKLVISKVEWTVDNDLITSAMKIKRKNIQKYFSEEIQNVQQNDF